MVLVTSAGWLLSAHLIALQPSAQVASAGVYTEQQAARGKAVSESLCLQCHGESLVGTEFGPPLVGKTFDDDFDGMTAGDLFDLIQTTMPQSNPGTLSPSQTADVTAYILEGNDFRSGQTPLPSTLDALKAIRIDAKRSTAK
jgi:mono/diheme cytochrome c family protein